MSFDAGAAEDVGASHFHGRDLFAGVGRAEVVFKADRALPFFRGELAG